VPTSRKVYKKMTNEQIGGFFNNATPHIQGNPNLRDPQVEGWFRTRQHFRNSRDHAILQIPVGCGKTGLMALLPFETAQRRRHCSRNQEHVICQGDKCLVIKENMSKNNYCMECAALILRKAQEELDGLTREMGTAARTDDERKGG